MLNDYFEVALEKLTCNISVWDLIYLPGRVMTTFPQYLSGPMMMACAL